MIEWDGPDLVRRVELFNEGTGEVKEVDLGGTYSVGMVADLVHRVNDGKFRP